MYCALLVIVLATLFKNGEQKGLFVVVPVLSGLQERLFLWEVSVCGDRRWRGKEKRVSALSFSRSVNGQA